MRDESLEILNTSFILLIFLFLIGYKENKILFWYNGLQIFTQGQIFLENNCLFYQKFHSSGFAGPVFMLKNVWNFEYRILNFWILNGILSLKWNGHLK